MADADADDPADENASPLAAYSQRLVASYFSDKLLRLVPEIVAYNLDRDSFPELAGSHLALERPALELVKFVTAVLALEPAVGAQVGKLKRTLLKLLRTSEFADEAAFRNPSLSFVVPDVICAACNLCRAVDLCRDPQLFRGSAAAAPDDDDSDEPSALAAAAWHCPRCAALYDKAAFERRLVELAEAQSAQFQLQDLVCRKCRLPNEHKLRSYCVCSGSFAVPPGARAAMRETLRVLGRVAQQHAFEWLGETVRRLALTD